MSINNTSLKPKIILNQTRCFL